MATAAAEELNALLNKHECFCLNESAAAPHANLFLEDDRLTLNSDADEQLLLHLAFQSTVRLQSIAIRAPRDDRAPTSVKLFVNRDNMGFDDAEELEATQVLELSPEDVAEGRQIPLKIVKFQRVNSLVLYFPENGGAETTSVSSVKLYGSTLDGLNVSDIHKSVLNEPTMLDIRSDLEHAETNKLPLGNKITLRHFQL